MIACTPAVRLASVPLLAAVVCTVLGSLPCDAQRSDEARFQRQLKTSCEDIDPIPVVTGAKRQTVRRNYIEVIYDARSGRMF